MNEIWFGSILGYYRRRRTLSRVQRGLRAYLGHN